jgi:hypothetical protein
MSSIKTEEAMQKDQFEKQFRNSTLARFGGTAVYFVISTTSISFTSILRFQTNNGTVQYMGRLSGTRSWLEHEI